MSEPVKAEDWHLKTSGLVEKEIDLLFDDMQKLPQTKVVRDFQCFLPNSIVFANPEPKEIKDLSIGDGIIGGDGKKQDT